MKQTFKLKREKLIEKLRRRQSGSQPSSPTPGPGLSSLAVPRSSSRGPRPPSSPSNDCAASSFLSASSGLLTPRSETGPVVAGPQPHQRSEEDSRVEHDRALATDSSAAELACTTLNNKTSGNPSSTPPSNLLAAAARQEDSSSQSPSNRQRFSQHSRELPVTPESEVPTVRTPQRPFPPRRQSLLPQNQAALVDLLLHGTPSTQRMVLSPQPLYTPLDSASPAADETMVFRKIWVKRPNGSPTMVTVNEDDVMDDVRDLVLAKYRNALGRAYDAPDVLLRIVPRQTRPRSHASHDNLHTESKSFAERHLQPDENVVKTLDEYYPGGQQSGEALVIEVPRRAPARNSPNYGMATSSNEVYEAVDSDYFSIVAGSGPHSSSSQHPPQLTSMPASPDARRVIRPAGRRMNTSSPTVFQNNSNNDTPRQKPIILRPRTRKTTMEEIPIDHPAIAATVISPTLEGQVITETPMRLMSVPSKKPKSPLEGSKSGLPNGGVPPINVLIVEDNIINLRLLEAFMKRLKVRWQSAMNGKEAVEKWRTGGFHLVLMDIQLPVMSGLEATKEIRRLENLNGIGVLAGGPETTEGNDTPKEIPEEDKLSSADLFKSPVIIVALTASSLQSDRNEALAAGCNDFLTKPVGFIFLEKKVTEWGCMQALIDFDGWRKWKEFPNSGVPSKHASGNSISAFGFGGGSAGGSSDSTITQAPPRKPVTEESALKQAVPISDGDDSA